MSRQTETDAARNVQPLYAVAEEIANSLTHGLGCALSVVGMVLLLAFASTQADPWKIVSFTIYGTSLILLFLASTLYHGFRHPELKRIFKIIDHCAIFLLIAGTYTPFLLVNMRGPTGWTLFAIIWGLAFAGIVFKIFFAGRFQILSVSIYLLMGWLIVFASSELVAKVAEGGVTLLAAGGITYSIGVIFYMLKRVPYTHAIWHLFVLGGSLCHFLAVFYYVLPSTAV